jgi:hypothetical protein
MITKEAKQILPTEMQKKLETVSELAPVTPPPDKYLIAIYKLVSDWKKSGEWKGNKKILTKYRLKNLTKQTKRSQFGTIIAITAPSVKPSSKSKYVTILKHALDQKLTADQLKEKFEKYGINDFVHSVRKKKKRSQARK